MLALVDADYEALPSVYYGRYTVESQRANASWVASSRFGLD